MVNNLHSGWLFRCKDADVLSFNREMKYMNLIAETVDNKHTGNWVGVVAFNRRMRRREVLALCMPSAWFAIITGMDANILGYMRCLWGNGYRETYGTMPPFVSNFIMSSLRLKIGGCYAPPALTGVPQRLHELETHVYGLESFDCGVDLNDSMVGDCSSAIESSTSVTHCVSGPVAAQAVPKEGESGKIDMTTLTSWSYDYSAQMLSALYPEMYDPK
jgi:hypothetical protein